MKLFIATKEVVVSALLLIFVEVTYISPSDLSIKKLLILCNKQVSNGVLLNKGEVRL